MTTTIEYFDMPNPLWVREAHYYVKKDNGVFLGIRAIKVGPYSYGYEQLNPDIVQNVLKDGSHVSDGKLFQLDETGDRMNVSTDHSKSMELPFQKGMETLRATMADRHTIVEVFNGLLVLLNIRFRLPQTSKSFKFKVQQSEDEMTSTVSLNDGDDVSVPLCAITFSQT